MFEMTASELQDIFCLDHNDVNRLLKLEVLTPKKNGLGKASVYGVQDFDRLLDIKMYLLAGFRIPDMPSIFTENFDADDKINKQIHVYKKRIQMLEFIQNIRSDIKAFDRLSQEQIVKAMSVTAQNTNMPEYGSKDYVKLFQGMLKLIFIIDYFSQEKSLAASLKMVCERFLDAYHTIEPFMKYLEIEISNKDICNALLEIQDCPVEDNAVVRRYVREWVTELKKGKQETFRYMQNEIIPTIVDGLDQDSSECYVAELQHFVQFIYEYFIGEEEIFCLISNFVRFVKGLDRNALLQEKIKMR